MGGFSYANSVNHNTVRISNGTVKGGTFYCYAYGYSVPLNVYGAYGGVASGKGSANYNEIYVSGGNINQAVGGSAYNGVATNNQAIVTGGTTKDVIGGVSCSKNATLKTS